MFLHSFVSYDPEINQWHDTNINISCPLFVTENPEPTNSWNVPVATMQWIYLCGYGKDSSSFIDFTAHFKY